MTDGTAKGTKKLWSRQLYPWSHMTPLGDRVVFTRAGQLWSTDGTVPGTKVLKSGGSPESLTRFRGKIYFSSDDSSHGRELWVTDGTQAGTKLLKDLVPGRVGSALRGNPGHAKGYEQFAVGNGRFYFISKTTSSGSWALWESDGSAAGTRVVTKKAVPENTVICGGKLFHGGVRGRACSTPSCGFPMARMRVPSSWLRVSGLGSYPIPDTMVCCGWQAPFRLDRTGPTAESCGFPTARKNGTKVIDIKPGSGSSLPVRVASGWQQALLLRRRYPGA